MTLFAFFVVFVCGIIVGRLYGWMKYHYPEFKAEIDARVAKKRAEEAWWKNQETRERLAEIEAYEEISNS